MVARYEGGVTDLAGWWRIWRWCARTGDIPHTNSGEEYNVVLPVQKIVRHPQFEILKPGSFQPIQAKQQNNIAELVYLMT